LLAVGVPLRLDDVILRRIGGHDTRVDLTEKLGFFLLPGQVVVRLADDVFRATHAGNLRKIPIAPQVYRVAVFPEDELRDVVHHQLQEPGWLVQIRRLRPWHERPILPECAQTAANFWRVREVVARGGAAG